MIQNQEAEAAAYAKAREANDFATAAAIAGEAVDLITDIPPAAEVIDRIVTEATALLSRASNRYRIAERG